MPVKLAKSDLTEQLADLLALSILYTYNVIKTPTDCFFFFLLHRTNSVRVAGGPDPQFHIPHLRGMNVIKSETRSLLSCFILLFSWVLFFFFFC